MSLAPRVCHQCPVKRHLAYLLLAIGLPLAPRSPPPRRRRPSGSPGAPVHGGCSGRRSSIMMWGRGPTVVLSFTVLGAAPGRLGAAASRRSRRTTGSWRWTSSASGARTSPSSTTGSRPGWIFSGNSCGRGNRDRSRARGRIPRRMDRGPIRDPRPLGSAPAAAPAFALPKPSRLILADAAGHLGPAKQVSENSGGVASLAGAKALLSSIFHGAPHGETDDAVRSGFRVEPGQGRHLDHPCVQLESRHREAGRGSGRWKSWAPSRFPPWSSGGNMTAWFPWRTESDFAARIAQARPAGVAVIPELRTRALHRESPRVPQDAIQPFLDAPGP